MLFFFFFSCEERLFHRSVRGDDYCPASQETEVRGEAAQLPHTSQPALRSEVPVEQQNLDVECIYYCWYGQEYILLGVIWRNLCGFGRFSIETIQPVISTAKSLLKLPLKRLIGNWIPNF